MAKQDSGEVFIAKVDREIADFCLIGTAPLICNRMSQKARQELLSWYGTEVKRRGFKVA